jgi:hypothetical protein
MFANKTIRALALLPMIAMGGCSSYLDHSDAISDAPGWSVRENAALQIIDPLPRVAFGPPGSFDGQRAMRVIGAYRGGSASEPAAPASSASSTH